MRLLAAWGPGCFWLARPPFGAHGGRRGGPPMLASRVLIFAPRRCWVLPPLCRASRLSGNSSGLGEAVRLAVKLPLSCAAGSVLPTVRCLHKLGLTADHDAYPQIAHRSRTIGVKDGLPVLMADPPLPVQWSEGGLQMRELTLGPVFFCCNPLQIGALGPAN